jgi:hypothetical protein
MSKKEIEHKANATMDEVWKAIKFIVNDSFAEPQDATRFIKATEAEITPKKRK